MQPHTPGKTRNYKHPNILIKNVSAFLPQTQVQRSVAFTLIIQLLAIRLYTNKHL